MPSPTTSSNISHDNLTVISDNNQSPPRQQQSAAGVSSYHSQSKWSIPSIGKPFRSPNTASAAAATRNKSHHWNTNNSGLAQPHNAADSGVTASSGGGSASAYASSPYQNHCEMCATSRMLSSDYTLKQSVLFDGTTTVAARCPRVY